eukprot:ctg_4874.g433
MNGAAAAAPLVGVDGAVPAVAEAVGEEALAARPPNSGDGVEEDVDPSPLPLRVGDGKLSAGSTVRRRGQWPLVSAEKPPLPPLLLLESSTAGGSSIQSFNIHACTPRSIPSSAFHARDGLPPLGPSASSSPSRRVPDGAMTAAGHAATTLRGAAASAAVHSRPLRRRAFLWFRFSWQLCLNCRGEWTRRHHLDACRRQRWRVAYRAPDSRHRRNAACARSYTSPAVRSVFTKRSSHSGDVHASPYDSMILAATERVHGSQTVAAERVIGNGAGARDARAWNALRTERIPGIIRA